VKVCAKCFSKDVVFAGETAMYAGLATSQNYYCKSCGYMGPLVVDMDETQWLRLNAERKKAEE
jgi:hypothetical protein